MFARVPAAAAFASLGIAALAMATAKPPPRGYIETADGTKLFYRVDGGASDRIVVLHGGPGLSMSYLQPDLGPLTERHTMISYDQRGAGRSTVTSDPSSVTATKHVEDLEAVRNVFGLDRMTLVGHSWGAGLAALYADRYPRRVRRLLLVDPIPARRTPFAEQFSANLEAWMDARTKRQVARLAAARRNAADPVAACRAYWAVFIHGYFANPARAAAAHGDVCNVPREAVQNQGRVSSLTLQSLGDWDWRPLLKAIRAPTLVVHGALDPIPLESAHEWAHGVPGARLLVIPDSGHFPFVEQPDRFFAAANMFLAGGWPNEAITP